MLTPSDLVKGISGLASLPEVCLRVNEMAENPRYSATDIGKVISQDTALTARLLKIANSPFYSHVSRVDTVSRAVTLIGARELRDLILAMYAMKTFPGISNTLVDMESFWRHNICCGVVGKILAPYCHVLHAERLFIAGLLHDIGHLVMYQKIPELMRVVLRRAREGGVPIEDVEREVLNFDHAQVGAELLRLWRLPESLQEIIEFHHEPARSERFALEASIVHIAGVIANRIDSAATHSENVDTIDPMAWEITGLTEEIVETILPEARVRFVEAQLLLLPGMKVAK
ncbi:MAG: HDOD domain-containing protein [Gammaproteobacteria bacterium]|nr:HDOD domain-containing protein [Gammaproteobacteria bacterium]